MGWDSYNNIERYPSSSVKQIYHNAQTARDGICENYEEVIWSWAIRTLGLIASLWAATPYQGT